MCLGVPGQIIDRHDDRGTPMAVVDFGGVTKAVCLFYTPAASVGDYIIVHAGFAIAVLDEEAARASLDLFEEIGIVDSDTPGAPS
jgi:hydrogenase expression/formation protein HypC